MTVERTPDGLAMRLGVAGIGRFIGAAFLGVWLTGWAAGEGFALWILGRGACSFITGRPPGVGHEPVGAIAALGAGLFLLAWLTLWTFGGIAAGREFLRMLFGRDVLLVRPDGKPRKAQKFSRGLARRLSARNSPKSSA